MPDGRFTFWLFRCKSNKTKKGRSIIEKQFSLTPLEPQSRFGLSPKRDCGSKRVKMGVAFASNQEISQLRTTIPTCRPRYPFFKSKPSLKIPSPRLLNLLGVARPWAFWFSSRVTARSPVTQLHRIKLRFRLFPEKSKESYWHSSSSGTGLVCWCG